MSTAKRAANTRNSEEQFFEVFFLLFQIGILLPGS
jgi:hypothetical protein